MVLKLSLTVFDNSKLFFQKLENITGITVIDQKHFYGQSEAGNSNA